MLIEMMWLQHDESNDGRKNFELIEVFYLARLYWCQMIQFKVTHFDRVNCCFARTNDPK